MEDSQQHQPYSIAMRAFLRVQAALRGTGLGQIRLLRDLRDAVYRLVQPGTRLTLDIDGIKLIIDPSRTGVEPQLVRDGVFERSETALLRSLLTPGMQFVDVGANIGYYTTLAARAVGPGGRVYAFEPEPTNFEFLSANVLLNGFSNVTLQRKALSNRPWAARLFINPNNTGGHQLFDTGGGGTTIDVEAITLDEFWQGAIPKIDVIKMDIEGYEPFALEGMSKTILATARTVLLTEFHPTLIAKAGSSGEAYLRKIRELGFAVDLVDEIHDTIRPADDAEIFAFCSRHLYTNLLCTRGDRK